MDELKSLCNEYEELQRDIKELEEKRDAIKPKLLELMPDDAKIDTGIGILTKSARIKWRYSYQTACLEEEVKQKKKEEEQTGAAEAVRGEPFLVYKAKKN